MPVIAVVAAGAEVYFGAAAIGTAVAAGAALATVEAGAMIVGGALTIIGTANGNQKLTQAGSLIGAAGGIAAMATNAMGLTGTAAQQGAGAAGSATASNVDAATGLPVNPPDISAGGAVSGSTATAPTFDPAHLLSPKGGVPDIAQGGAVPSIPNIAPAGGAAPALSAGQQQLAQYDKISGMLKGIDTAVSSRTNADIAAQTSANQLAFQQQQYNTAMANANALPSNIPVQGTGMLATGMAPITRPGVTTGAVPRAVGA